MNKRIQINVIDLNKPHSFSKNMIAGHISQECYLETISKEEYPYISVGYKVDNDNLEHAIDIITTWLMQNEKHSIVVELDERNNEKSPVKEMTLGEIEKKLGYKVKIINKEKEKK